MIKLRFELSRYESTLLAKGAPGLILFHPSYSHQFFQILIYKPTAWECYNAFLVDCIEGPSISQSCSFVSYILSCHSFHHLSGQPNGMLVHVLYAAVLALSAATVGGSPRPGGNALPDCAAAPAECKCPFGTTLSSSTTYAIIGASANDVKAITGSCEQFIFQLLT